MPGLKPENLLCFVPNLQFNKLYGYETRSVSSQMRPREAESNPLLFPEELIAGCLSLKERPMNMICFIHAAHDP